MAEQPLMDPSRAAQISLPEETKYAPNGIVSRTVMRSATVRVVLFGFAEGQELSEHSAPYLALVQALSGECDFTVSGVVHRLRAGDLLSMPAGAPHALKAVTSFSMLLTLVTAAPAPLPGATSALPRSPR